MFINLCFVGKLTYNCFSTLISDEWIFLCQAQLPYNLSDKLHETLCPARLKKLRPIQIIVTCQQMLKHTMQDQLLWLTVQI